MKVLSINQLQDLKTEIEIELSKLTHLAQDLQKVRKIIEQPQEDSTPFYESLALKLHNFYTGCERIFRLIAVGLNGNVPSTSDWHRRLLERMSMTFAERPAVISHDTAVALREYLGFRHVVRNLYGYELNQKRLEQLVEEHLPVWQRFDRELQEFVQWIQSLIEQLRGT
ncbi:MAG: hypothetical protein BWK78_04885 [Thiotrichaceae bacterium IS1]|nr:MAG: hypothetical protein BWK78_04885 [Thiotrichaceae bacterium IS1]